MKELLIEHIAPCGMNCGLCISYTRKKNPCHGCLGNDLLKPNQRRVCIIKRCENLNTIEKRYCSYCGEYPCLRLTKLDKRYKGKYGMSMLENLKTIKEEGITTFIKRQQKRWTCPNCLHLFSVHRETCMNCGTINPYYGVYKSE